MTLKRPASPLDSEKPSKMSHQTPVANLLIKRLSPTAQLPTRGSSLAAGYDLYASVATVVPANGKALVSTGVSMAVPAGTYGRVAPRSGLASKFGIHTGAGVVDADYRGEVFVLLFNLGEKDLEVKVGDRIAQLILERILTPEVLEVEDLDATIRGAGGFGSTGGFTDEQAKAVAEQVVAEAEERGATEVMETIVKDGANVV
ncbi:hypothetical protein NliqN6_0142 [Naganishia liquefaciens]|uniref:Deoxyuridine 5'-triphosphate nucleotidohydrolase n=1 Tax=Naganishia liquefaciens TaxID=104408 RepID=A0A8H3YBZ5_9TREE|nr:hypothetical protein NliqN6_0142 [Naganishia liquefaciens]